jgi:phosphoribosyl-ATP pyrophosphohydrolase/phosphoribosyl-AMP cyclohydrolase
LTDSHLGFLTTLESIINDRFENPVRESYTSSLVAGGTKRIAQKVGEEAVELALAAATDNRVETINEAADLFFHVLVLLRNQGICLADIAAELESRHTG